MTDERLCDALVTFAFVLENAYIIFGNIVLWFDKAIVLYAVKKKPTIWPTIEHLFMLQMLNAVEKLIIDQRLLECISFCIWKQEGLHANEFRR